MLLPIRGKNPPESFPFVTCILIAINVAVYALTSDGFLIRPEMLEMWGLKGSHFDVVHVVSAMFLHVSLLHIVGNMWFLYLFGFAVEGRLRTVRFLFVYFASGVAGAVLHQVVFGRAMPDVPSLGASGAIMGIVGAALYLFPHAQVTFAWFFSFRGGIADWPVWGVAIYYLGFDMLWAFIGMRDGVAHSAHLGGAAGGLVATMILRPRRDSEAASAAKAMLADTKDLGTLSRYELSELFEVNPTSALVALHWMSKSIREPHGVKPPCIEAFFSLLPQMIRDIDPRSIAPCLLALAETPNLVTARQLLDLAPRLERVGDYFHAQRCYELSLRSPDAEPADWESALFRLGMLAESTAQDMPRAASYYQQILDRWPMGTFAPQARARLIQVTQSRA